MSERLRVVLLLLGCLGLFVVVGLITRATTDFDAVRDHSSERRNPWGIAAWRELLERCGVATATWNQPLTELGPQVGLLVLVDPVSPLAGEELDALVRWVSGGGRLVVAPFAHRATGSFGGRAAQASLTELLGRLGLRTAAGWALHGTATVRSREPLTADVAEVVVPSEGRLAILPRSGVDQVGAPRVLLADDQGAAAVAVPVGKGLVVALAEVEMLGNATLREADNVVLAANLVFAPGAPETVHFDEYHHGARGPAGVFQGPQVDPSPFRNTGLALLAVIVVFALGRARRFGAPLTSAPPRQPAGVEYVHAFAELYARAGAGGAAAAMLADGLRRRLAQAAGAPASAPETVLLAALQRRGVPVGDLEGLLGRLAEARERGIGNRDLLALAREVARYERMLR